MGATSEGCTQAAYQCLLQGPAFTALGTGSSQVILFVVAMLAGMVVARMLSIRSNILAGKTG